MNKIIIILLLASTFLVGQEFKVEKVTGKVLLQKGVEENFTIIKKGDFLSGNDLVLTEKNSFIQLQKEGNLFILNSNSALGLSYIRKISINDLLLALAMEDIRNVPKKNSKGIEKNTAVYGEKIKNSSTNVLSENRLGKMKINGAKQLAQSGFAESAIIVSKDTFRKYPETKLNFEDRIYFAELLEKLNLKNETLDEYNSIRKLPLTPPQKQLIDERVEAISIKSINE